MSNKSAILLFLPHATALENALHVSYLDHYNILLMGLFVFNFVQQQNFMHTDVKRILINEHPLVALHCLKSLNVSSSHISFDRNFRICLHHIINQFSSLPHIHSALPYFLYAIIFLNMGMDYGLFLVSSLQKKKQYLFIINNMRQKINSKNKREVYLVKLQLGGQKGIEELRIEQEQMRKERGKELGSEKRKKKRRNGPLW